MHTIIPTISLQGLILAFIPAAIVIGIMFRWQAHAGNGAYAAARMLIQLLLIGYVLIYIFEAKHFGVIVAVLTIMLVVASRIAIRPMENPEPRTYVNALVAIALGGIPILALVTQAVIKVEPWYSPRYVVPLAGMIFAAAMNAVSLAAERYQAECARGCLRAEARRVALHASLIPIINGLFAVGLVSLPGMMTGQILAGVSPLIAAKYQIVVMTMLFGASGLSAALYLTLVEANRRPA